VRFASGDQTGKVLPCPTLRHGAPGAGIQQVVIDLYSIEATAVDDLPAARRTAQSSEADIPREALLACSLERRGCAVFAKYVLRRNGARRRRWFDRVVQKQEVDGVTLQPLQTVLKAALDLPADVVQSRRVEQDLSRDKVWYRPL